MAISQRSFLRLPRDLWLERSTMVESESLFTDAVYYTVSTVAMESVVPLLIGGHRAVNLVVAPTPLVAANFILLGRIIRRLGPQYSRLTPRRCKSPKLI